MSTIIPFTFPETGQSVRTVTIDGKPWWVARDVCAVLGLANVGNVVARLDDADVSSIRLTDGTPGNPNRAIVNESGLYDVILDSRRPEARAFRRWITADVIPSIRETGSYRVPAARFEVPASFAEALELAARQARELESASARVAELEPVAHSWTVLASGDGDFAVADAAKILSRDDTISIGRNRLFALLAEYRWTYRQPADDKPRAMQTVVDRGWLSELPQSYEHPRTGELVLTAPQVRVTAKGLHELHKRLGGSCALVIEGGAL